MKRKWKRGRMIPNDRDMEMWRLVQAGQSFTDVSKQYGISRERVRQILTGRFNVTGKNYPKNDLITAAKIERKILSRDERDRRKEQRYSKVFGCSVDVVTQINGGPFTRNYGDNTCPASKYYSQRANAGKRGINWDITFPEWWRIWQESGKWSLRGPGQGYCMARYGDSGGYEVNNVYICTIGQNFSDSYIIKTTRRRRVKEFCKRGHPLSGDNLYIYPKNGTRYCRECQTIRAREYKFKGFDIYFPEIVASA